ncbi:precorrin-6A/cobalt-precorrin-6A reductase [Albimonas pacifica]|uniref:Precorrin-6A/cobalt-precorrin-6A reductase n=1 Tax=Albimonas pacifica TaxID=1114924 RepID=A0A1I3C317_9RHOB|nr:precorrin-6A/cobalt-precorrin-6A reductase [Albimonas pacifica]SFH68965.1 precorrin-6A/cobalt-precorrin-6A reductase [Albimonas pacifica]
MAAEPPRLLVLAGTAEARAVLEALAPAVAESRLRVLASLAGATRAPRPLPVETRRGGFGGAEGLAAFLRARRIDAVLDATHPFAARISANAAAACAAVGAARAQLLRPGWDGPARRFPDLASALAAAPPGARVLAATGRASAPALQGRGDLEILLRVAESGPPIPGVETLVSRPPHAPEADRALMRGRAISHLLARDSGGADGAKLHVARELGIEILLAERPPAEPGAVLPGAPEALDWVLETLVLGR